MSNNIHFGIDLGTTNSVISMAQVRPDGRIIASPIDIERFVDSGPGIGGKITYTKRRSRTLPSCVYYNNLDGKVIVGDFAREEYTKYPDRVAKSIKSQMGNAAVRGLSDSVADKSPEEISARILSHLRMFANMQTRINIKDVIITVPANFDTARREATMRAAELAGFDVKNTDGSWKPILISEPNAVLYDLTQKILNGEVAESVLDLSKKKRVVVFDIGGGTLDVTFHEIEKDPETGIALNISEIAASRFTQLAGDDCDNAVAEKLYERCLQKLETYDPRALTRVKTKEALIKKKLAVSAEQLKIGINSSVDGGIFGSDDWFGTFEDTDEEITYDVSQEIDDGIFYNDTISKSDFEAMLAPFMGSEYKFEDYRGYSKNKKISRNTIISPVLDVLEKAARYYDNLGEELKVDAVILNGGMSKLYLIKDRIEEFFGLEPITTADPDLSVANGAAVYAALRSCYNLSNHITIKQYVQNEDIYLGLSAGANDLLVSAGDRLPLTKEISGYRVLPGTQRLEIPIKRGEDQGEPRIIARGIISFNRTYVSYTNLKIEATFDINGLLSIKASLYSNMDVLLETTAVQIALGAPLEKNHGGERIIPANGAILVAANELDALKNLFSSKNKSKNKKAQIDCRLNNIINCGNPADFEDVILRHLGDNNNPDFRFKLYTIVAALAPCWSEKGRTSLCEVARRDMISRGYENHVSNQRNKLSDYVKNILDQINV